MVVPVDLLSEFFNNWSYVGIFLLVALIGHLLPIPEEIWLVVIGYLTAQGLGNVYIMLPVMILASAAGGNVNYWLGRSGNRLLSRFKDLVLPKSKRKRFEKFMGKNLARTLFFSRWLYSFRAFMAIMAGMHKVRYRTYLFWDGLSVLIHTPFYFLMGYFFHNHLTRLIDGINSVGKLFGLLFILAIVTICVLLLNAYVLKNAEKSRKA